jgi:hypothetical protein
MGAKRIGRSWPENGMTGFGTEPLKQPFVGLDVKDIFRPASLVTAAGTCQLDTYL